MKVVRILGKMGKKTNWFSLIFFSDATSLISACCYKQIQDKTDPWQEGSWSWPFIKVIDKWKEALEMRSVE